VPEEKNVPGKGKGSSGISGKSPLGQVAGLYGFLFSDSDLGRNLGIEKRNPYLASSHRRCRLPEIPG